MEPLRVFILTSETVPTNVTMITHMFMSINELIDQSSHPWEYRSVEVLKKHVHPHTPYLLCFIIPFTHLLLISLINEYNATIHLTRLSGVTTTAKQRIQANKIDCIKSMQ